MVRPAVACSSRQAAPESASQATGSGRLLACESHAEWRGDPHAEALEAVHQPAERPVADARPKAHDDVGRTVLLGEQVRHAPGGQRREHESME